MAYLWKIVIAFFWLFVTFTSAWLWGKLLFYRLLKSNWSEGEKFVFQISLGLGVISYFIFGLSLVGFLYRSVVFSFLLLPLLWFGIFRRRHIHFPDRLFSFPGKTPALPRVGFLLVALVFLVFLLNLASSFTPPYAGDALGYHLAAPRAYLQAHKLIWLEGNVLANQPATIDMLFVIGFAGKSEFFPQLLHCFWGCLTACSLFVCGRRYFGSKAAFLAAAIFYTIPSVAIISSWAYIDLGLSLWVMLAIFIFLKWREKGGIQNLALSAIFAGLAMGSKYTGLIFFALLGLLALGDCIFSKKGKKAVGQIVFWGLLALVVAFPWYLKNLLISGNPVYPFLYPVLGGRGWDTIRATYYREKLLGYGMGRRLLDYLLLPWNLTVNAAYKTYQNFDGKIGPVFLLFLPLLFFIKRKSFAFRFLGFYCALYFIIWSSLSQQIRMLIPVLTLAALLVGKIIVGLWERGSREFKIIIALVFGFALGTSLLSIVGEFKKVDPLKSISGRESKEAFLSRMVYNYPAVKYINENLGPQSLVLFVYGGNAWYYCQKETVVDSIFQGVTLKKMLRDSNSVEELSNHLRSRGITHFLFNFDFAGEGFSDLSLGKRRLWKLFLRQKVKPLFTDGANFVFEIHE